jgi:peptidyl-prolyl cis-trans isomerase A (cyclophilin A)
MSRRFSFLSITAAVGLTACGGESTPKSDSSAAAPVPAATTETAPPVFRTRFETSKGPFVVEAHRDWAPLGVDRFYQLVKSGFFDNSRFFRIVPGFVVQFGLHADPAVSRTWEPLTLTDDPVAQSNKRGYVSFATSGPNSRTTQMFINLGDNVNLDGMGFSPIGLVVEGMSIVDRFNAEYEEGPNQARIRESGNAYLEKEFPRLDFIRTARIEEAPVADSSARRDSAKK